MSNRDPPYDGVTVGVFADLFIVVVYDSVDIDGEASFAAFLENWRSVGSGCNVWLIISCVDGINGRRHSRLLCGLTMMVAGWVWGVWERRNGKWYEKERNRDVAQL